MARHSRKMRRACGVLAVLAATLAFAHPCSDAELAPITEGMDKLQDAMIADKEGIVTALGLTRDLYRDLVRALRDGTITPERAASIMDRAADATEAFRKSEADTLATLRRQRAGQ